MSRKYLIAKIVACAIIISVVQFTSGFITSKHHGLHPKESIHRNESYLQMIFHELVSNDEDDLRVDITSIHKKDSLEKFLHQDERLCVIKVFAPFCRACKAFGKKFRKLAIDRGDAINSIGEIARNGDARFGEIDFSSKLVKELGIKQFPTVLIYRKSEMLSEIACKHDAIDKITAQMDNHLSKI